MDQDSARLGAALKATRLARDPKLTQEGAAAALNVSRATVQNLERGTGSAKVSPTVRAYAQLLGWTADSVDRVLAGGEPRIAGEPGAEPSATFEPSRLPLRIVDEIESGGALVDTAVIPLGEDATMVIVVKGRPDASPAEIQAALEAWRRAQPQLRDLSADQDQLRAANGA
ncbi:helix-turn-helix transcriptional regulator [Streptomyces sp. NPDC052069]|uniref:helix-turn-helix domain-containing protein n=1 Tax=Streptomyces sp. NPDC052069 TaxID=3154650 RepID=UPI003417E65E